MIAQIGWVAFFFNKSKFEQFVLLFNSISLLTGIQPAQGSVADPNINRAVVGHNEESYADHRTSARAGTREPIQGIVQFFISVGKHRWETSAGAILSRAAL